jgi:hypothetical protein
MKQAFQQTLKLVEILDETIKHHPPIVFQGRNCLVYIVGQTPNCWSNCLNSVLVMAWVWADVPEHGTSSTLRS